VVKLGNWDGKGIDEYYATPTTYEQQDTPLYHSAKKKLRKVNKNIKHFLWYLWVSYPTIKLFWYVFRHKNEYDFLHIHSVWGATLFTFFKPKIVEFHGDDVRHKPTMYRWIRRLPVKIFVNFYGIRNKIYVSTPDLLGDVPNGVWLPNIVDTEHFKSISGLMMPNTALYCSAWYESGEHAKTYSSEHNLCLTILDRKGGDWIDHRSFPKYLNQFEYYIDRKEIHSLSKTALEALACGLKVVDWQGNILTGLPEIHKPENVAKLSIKIYQEKLKNAT
jgi:hypothetical protein